MSCSSLQNAQPHIASIPRELTGPWLLEALGEVGVWLARKRERHALAGLGHRLLADIGVRSDAATRETAKPFWRR